MIAFCMLGSIVGFTLANAAGNTSQAIVNHYRIKVKVVVHEMNAKDFAKKLVSPKDFKCLDYIWTKESHWNPNAKESSTHALGIPQLLPSTWRLLNYNPTTNPDAQVLAGLVYIYEHYGSSGICVAAKHSAHFGWY